MHKPESDVIERYFDNRCSHAEAKAVLEWLATDEGQVFYEKYLDDLIKGQDTDSSRHVTIDKQKTLEGIYGRINRQKNLLTPQSYRWYWAAATIALLLLSTWITFHVARPDRQTAETAHGETRSIALSDGTTVILNANSKIQYQSNRTREVWLQGEAFFKVFHTQDDASFKVHTSDLTIDVLGTEFNVNTRHKKTDVVLKQGKVRLELESDLRQESLIMHPGDKISYAHQESTFEKKTVNTDTYTSWTSGTIIFDHTPLKEIFQLIEDTYGVKIEAKDQDVLEKEFTGEVVQDLDVMVTLLEKSFGLEASKKVNTIYLN